MPAVDLSGHLPRLPDAITHLVAYAGAHGLPPGAALAGTGLSTTTVEVTAAQERRVLRNLMAHLGPAGGAALGRSYRLRTYGALGYAILASPTLAEAVALALRFFDQSHAFVSPGVTLAGPEVVVDLDARAVPRDLRGFVLDRDAEAIRAALGELLPGTPVVRDGARLSFPAHHLARPLPGADAELCAELGVTIVDRRRVRTGVAGDTRVVILQHLPDGAPMPAVAATLGASERTLRRQLAAAGTTYRVLLDEVRSSLAEALLARGLGTGEISSRLGYAEPAAYCHARRRWIR